MSISFDGINAKSGKLSPYTNVKLNNNPDVKDLIESLIGSNPICR